MGAGERGKLSEWGAVGSNTHETKAVPAPARSLGPANESRARPLARLAEERQVVLVPRVVPPGPWVEEEVARGQLEDEAGDGPWRGRCGGVVLFAIV